MTDRIELPDKKYLGIKEVAEICEISQSILRAWETKFDCLKDVRRRKNRRYYTHENVRDILRIKNLTQEKGYTLDGANQFMKSGTVDTQTSSTSTLDSSVVAELLLEIQSIRESLKT